MKKNTPVELDAIAKTVLSYKPPEKAKATNKRKKQRDKTRKRVSYPAGLVRAVKESMAHWDALQKPYPDHLQAAIDQLGISTKK